MDHQKSGSEPEEHPSLPTLRPLPDGFFDELFQALVLDYPELAIRERRPPKKLSLAFLHLQIMLVAYRIETDASLKHMRSSLTRLQDACKEFSLAIQPFVFDQFSGMQLVFDHLVPKEIQPYFDVANIAPIRNKVSELGLVCKLVLEGTRTRGRPRDIPFESFTGFVELLATNLQIEVRLPTNWETKEPNGAFFRLAELLERRLYPLLKELGFRRSHSRQALAKRLERSLHRMRTARDKKRSH